MMLFTQTGDTHKVVSTAGDELNSSIKKCIKYCKEKGCKILLNFNGTEHLITQGSYAKILADNWYIESFDLVANQRDKKLKDLGI